MKGQAARIGPVYCHKCGKLMVHTLSGATVFCPRCRVWTKGSKLREGPGPMRAKPPFWDESGDEPK